MTYARCGLLERGKELPKLDRIDHHLCHRKIPTRLDVIEIAGLARWVRLTTEKATIELGLAILFNVQGDLHEALKGTKLEAETEG